MNKASDGVELTHILFDFFGTLVAYCDSRIGQGCLRSYNLLTDNGYHQTYPTFVEQWDRLFGEFEERSVATQQEFAMTDLCACFLQQTLGTNADAVLIESFRDTYLAEWSRSVTYLDGVNEMLAELAARYTLVLVSNTHHAELVKGHLRASGMAHYFRHVITSVEHGMRKPSRAIFDYAVQVCQTERRSALFVGDSYGADYQGARAAGLACFLIDPMGRHQVPEAHRLSGIFDLPLAISTGKLPS